MAALVKFMMGSAGSFDLLPEKDFNTLYFLNDSYQIYKGDQLYCQSFKVVDSLPEQGREGFLYIEKPTEKFYVWDKENNVFEVILDTSDSVIDDNVTEESMHPVTSNGIFNFVLSQIEKRLTWIPLSEG